MRTSALSALPLPDDLAAAIRACDEASDAVRAARQAYTEARSAYTEASKPPAEPEAVDRAHQALRNAQHQVQVADAALRRAEKAVTEGIKAHRLELLPAAIALAEQGMAQYEEAHAEASRILLAAGKRYADALGPLDLLAPYFKAVHKFTVDTATPPDMPGDHHIQTFGSLRRLLAELDRTFVQRRSGYRSDAELEQALNRF